GLEAYRGFGHPCSAVVVAGPWAVHLGGAWVDPQAVRRRSPRPVCPAAAPGGPALSVGGAAAYLGRPAPRPSTTTRGVPRSTQQRRRWRVHDADLPRAEGHGHRAPAVPGRAAHQLEER